MAWRDDATWAPHGGESRVDVAERSLPLVAELVDSPTEWGGEEPDRPVVLVAHGGLIAALTAALLGLPGRQLADPGRAWATPVGCSCPGIRPTTPPMDEIRWRLDVWNASAQVANDVL